MKRSAHSEVVHLPWYIFSNREVCKVLFNQGQQFITNVKAGSHFLEIIFGLE